MPNINHAGNHSNAILLDGMRSSLVTRLSGRTTGLPIYEISIGTLHAAGRCGENLIRLIQSMEKDGMRDARKRGPGQQFPDLTRQPTDHDDRDGNLPVPPPGYGYREYNIPKNLFPWPGFPRLVADVANKRLYLTPTHYDTWFDDQRQAYAQAAATPGGNRSPFYLLRSVFRFNPLFD